MAGTSNIVKGFLMYFLMPILIKISVEPTRESLIKIHRLVGGNVVYMASNLVGVWYSHLTLAFTAEDYLVQTGHAFGTPHNTNNCPPMMRAAQEQALGIKRFRKINIFSDTAPT